MASVLRTGLGNIRPNGVIAGLCKAASRRRNVSITQIACISGRALRRDRPPKPPPFDYKNKDYGFWHYNRDYMIERFDENTKVITIEGLPAVGKSKFAKQLAEELEMHYVPPPTFDTIWINPYGDDYRKLLNHKLPIDAQFFDIDSFLKDPTGRNTAPTQLGMLFWRSYQYVWSILHLLSTGQGVILQRSPFSDRVFMDAMFKHKYVSKGAHSYYNNAIETTLPEFIKPHLVIYLDAPVSVVKDNIKKRNREPEVSSKALTAEYLQDIDNNYKRSYLKDITKDAHLLIYDWSKEGDVGLVVEDIERLDFEIKEHDSTNEKFHQWKYDHVSELKEMRMDYCYYKYHKLSNIMVCRFDVPEMLISGEDSWEQEKALKSLKSEKYAPGFVPGFDEGILFKMYDKFEDRLPREKKPAVEPSK